MYNDPIKRTLAEMFAISALSVLETVLGVILSLCISVEFAVRFRKIMKLKILSFLGIKTCILLLYPIAIAILKDEILQGFLNEPIDGFGLALGILSMHLVFNSFLFNNVFTLKQNI